jgi:hypothetical protein
VSKQGDDQRDSNRDHNPAQRPDAQARHEETAFSPNTFTQIILRRCIKTCHDGQFSGESVSQG